MDDAKITIGALYANRAEAQMAVDRLYKEVAGRVDFVSYPEIREVSDKKSLGKRPVKFKYPAGPYPVWLLEATILNRPLELPPDLRDTAPGSTAHLVISLLGSTLAVGTEPPMMA